MKISSSCILLFSMVTSMTLNVTAFSFSDDTTALAGDHQSVVKKDNINLLSIRNGKRNIINAFPSSSSSSHHASLIKRKSSSKKNKKKQKKSHGDDDEEEEEDNEKKSSKKKQQKKKVVDRNSSKKNCEDRVCPLVLKPCPKDCPQSCGYLNSPDPCCPLLGTAMCPDY